MTVTNSERLRISVMQAAPDAETLRAEVRRYLSITGMSIPQFADELGRGQSTIGIWLTKSYRVKNDDLLRRKIWDFLQRHQIDSAAELHRSQSGHLYETQNWRIIRTYMMAACERGEVCLLYGPPGTQKTFALSRLVADRNRERRNDAIYVYASQGMRSIALLKRIAQGLGVFSQVRAVEALSAAIVRELLRRQKAPAIIVDEAQHLGVEPLEILRELHDRTGCGLVLAGSHRLFENFLRGRQHLEQWLSRIDHKDPLPGLLAGEIREIASREMGNGHPAELSSEQLKAIFDACAVDDVFSRGEDGRTAPRKYFSVRRLVKFLDQVKARTEGVQA
jgi:DNA transposition AAA+ family ATPase